jgi:hypothetical protein
MHRGSICQFSDRCTYLLTPQYLIHRTDNSQIAPVCNFSFSTQEIDGRNRYSVAAAVLYLIEKELPLTAAVFHAGWFVLISMQIWIALAYLPQKMNTHYTRISHFLSQKAPNCAMANLVNLLIPGAVSRSVFYLS